MDFWAKRTNLPRDPLLAFSYDFAFDIEVGTARKRCIDFDYYWCASFSFNLGVVMSTDGPRKRVSKSYVVAETRAEAVRKMILPDPFLSLLYDEGKAKDGKGGWVNAIRDQSGKAYRLLLYIDKLELAKEFSDREPYEVLYGEIRDDGEPNYPRMLYTMSGAINLMRDGIPSERFALDLLRSELQMVPFDAGKDVQVKHLLASGYGYICVYDRDGEGIRALDLNEYHEIFDIADENEIQVRNSEEVIIGDTKFVRPFLIRYAPKSFYENDEDPAAAAQAQLDRLAEG